MSDWIDVAPADAFGPDSWHVVDVDGTEVAVFNVDGNYYAVEDLCTHDGGELAGGEVEGTEVVCPRHGARFCLKTGAALTPPAYDPIETFPVRIEQGMVQVRDDRWD
ncbi:MAG: non-heme iron oxygenase ferredoxin subunit [Gammaproteobacteria bacterium]|nr:non-heme iron oxygenase ferredoxin subunit [Gammaproteobacteria bacterium]